MSMITAVRRGTETSFGVPSVVEVGSSKMRKMDSTNRNEMGTANFPPGVNHLNFDQETHLCIQ